MLLGPLTARTILAILLVATPLSLTGCVGSQVRVESISSDAVLAPPLPFVAYSPIGPNSADLYFTDLPRNLLHPGADLRETTGHIVHVHMFLKPKAGATPIEDTATNATVRHLVIAGRTMGLYEGAGFLLPDQGPGGAVFRGNLRGATVRLAASNSGFADLLGPSAFAAGFNAPRDDTTSRLIRRRIDALAEQLTSLNEHAR